MSTVETEFDQRMRFIRNWKISLPVAGVVLAGLAWLAFGFFGIQTAFIDDEVSEAAPVFDVPADPADPANMPDAADAASEPAAATVPADASTDVEAAESVDAAEPAATDSDATEAPEPDATDAPAEAASAETAPAETTPAEPQIVTEASGSFAGTSRYDVSGEAVVLGNGTGQRFLRFEDFESSNGPDLNVYLFNPDDPNDFIDLGDLKGNIGEQNYELAADIDLDRYSEVSIWCVRFGTGFGSADLASA